MRSFLINELEPIAYATYMIALLLQFNQYKHERHWVLFLYYFFAATVLYAGIVLTEDGYTNLFPKNSKWHILTEGNNWSYNLLYIVNIFVFSWFFYILLHDKLKKRMVAVCCVCNVVLFTYVDIVFRKFFSDFNSTIYGLVFLTIVLYTLLYLHQLLRDIKEENLLADFDFWLICGYVLYYLGSFVIVIYYQNAGEHQRGNIWAMHNIILFICSLMLLTAYFRIPTYQKRPL
ncbi:hypothetical protein FC093_22860 [Ilyomonas limi]|uniref:Uncharacterized protein n=1 Tax=Ilyomonas limi TaxID=2575867 RepID=A0A4V5UTC1_9BACT|nr:hypothetical protein [Ilyomonas limi]TKK64273.1 hypothetical protein FC093_22860 [Ilyomonas limi]